MTRGSKLAIAAGIVVVVLVGLGVWRRSQLITEREDAQTARVAAETALRITRDAIVRTTVAAGALETESGTIRAEVRELVAIAESLAGEINRVQQERDNAAVIALVAGGQVGELRRCLDGINRALNQVSVGDPNAVGTLANVRNDCRAVG